MTPDLIRRLGRTAAAALLSASVLAPAALAQTATAERPAQKPAAAAAEPSAPATPRPPARPKPPADQPAIKTGNDYGEGFLGRHVGFLKDRKAMAGKVDLLLVGDSITDGWRSKQDMSNPKSWGGKSVFDEAFAGLNVLNLGIGGDQTQHVIWRLENGEIAGISPKAAMLMIGTNNLGGYSNDEIVAGVTKIVGQLNEKLPKTKVLLLGIFPRGAKADDRNRARIKEINEKIAKLDDGGKTVKYLDIGDKFLDKDGAIPADVMPDALHPNDKGYKIWADAVKPVLEELMK